MSAFCIECQGKMKKVWEDQGKGQAIYHCYNCDTRAYCDEDGCSWEYDADTDVLNAPASGRFL